MADISSYINDIKTAIYGEEVRGSIVNALEKSNTEIESTTATADALKKAFDEVISSGGNTNAEVIQARGTFDTLGNRLDDVDTKLASGTGAKVETYTISVQASKYIEVSGVWTQTISCTGMKTEYSPMARPVLSENSQETRAQQLGAYNVISVISTSNNAVQIICDTDPTELGDISIYMEVIH